MSLQLKSIISLILLAQMVVELYCMLEITGREKSRFDPAILRRIHILNGRAILAVFLILSYYCLLILKAMPGEISSRALIHSILAIGALLMLTVKILFIRVYKKFITKVASFGLTIFFLTAGLVAASGGYYFVSMGEAQPPPKEAAAKQPETQPSKADIAKGQELFEKWCLGCHDNGSGGGKFGPNMKGIFKTEKLPVSELPVTVENIRRQLVTPYKMMPPQKQLKDNEVKQIIEYLKTL